MEKILELFRQLIMENWHVQINTNYNEFHCKLQLNATAIYIGPEKKKPFQTGISYYTSDKEREEITIQHLEIILKNIKNETN